ncbi:hypothetical protein B0H14DRAFT_2972613, partial [Mycena olivaceomarginata]
MCTPDTTRASPSWASCTTMSRTRLSLYLAPFASAACPTATQITSMLAQTSRAATEHLRPPHCGLPPALHRRLISQDKLLTEEQLRTAKNLLRYIPEQDNQISIPVHVHR